MTRLSQLPEEIGSGPFAVPEAVDAGVPASRLFARLVTAAEVHGFPLPPWAEFRPDDGGPVTAVVEPVPWGARKADRISGLRAAEGRHGAAG